MPRNSGEPLYVISVAARLVASATDRVIQHSYERMGLIEPRRSDSNVRMYSDNDIDRLRQIQRLTQDMGVNLAGVEIVLKLLERIEELQDEVDRLRRDLQHGPRRLKPPAHYNPEIVIIDSRDDEREDS